MLELEKLLPKKTPVRQLRVAELIKKIIAEVLTRKDVDNPIINDHFITISKVKVSPDLHNATIFITVFQTNNLKELLTELNKLAPKFRFFIAKNIQTKSSPQLIFRYDDTIDQITKINELLTSQE
jgi:ribosome-binding factor A